MKPIYTDEELDFCVGMMCKIHHYNVDGPSKIFPPYQENLRILENRKGYYFLNKTPSGYIIAEIPAYDKMKKNNKLLRLLFE